MTERSSTLLFFRLHGCGVCRRIVRRWITTNSRVHSGITTRKESCRKWPANVTSTALSAILKRSTHSFPDRMQPAAKHRPPAPHWPRKRPQSRRRTNLHRHRRRPPRRSVRHSIRPRSNQRCDWMRTTFRSTRRRSTPIHFRIPSPRTHPQHQPMSTGRMSLPTISRALRWKCPATITILIGLDRRSTIVPTITRWVRSIATGWSPPPLLKLCLTKAWRISPRISRTMPRIVCRLFTTSVPLTLTSTLERFLSLRCVYFFLFNNWPENNCSLLAMLWLALVVGFERRLNETLGGVFFSSRWTFFTRYVLSPTSWWCFSTSLVTWSWIDEEEFFKIDVGCWSSLHIGVFSIAGRTGATGRFDEDRW